MYTAAYGNGWFQLCQDRQSIFTETVCKGEDPLGGGGGDDVCSECSRSNSYECATKHALSTAEIGRVGGLSGSGCSLRQREARPQGPLELWHGRRSMALGAVVMMINARACAPGRETCSVPQDAVWLCSSCKRRRLMSASQLQLIWASSLR